MRFDTDTLKNRYQTCRSYLEKRCEALPGQIERKFKNVSCYHEASTCFGMSNYINVEIQDENGDYVDSFDVRISDHSPTGSGTIGKSGIFSGSNGAASGCLRRWIT